MLARRPAASKPLLTRFAARVAMPPLPPLWTAERGRDIDGRRHPFEGHAPMYTLYGIASSASLVPHILLRELGVPHRLVLLDQAAGEHRTPDYINLNPNARVPTLLDDDLVVYETAAICLHLCDRHAEAGLAPPPGTAERARFYQWMMWLTNTVHPDMLMYFYAERYVPADRCDALRTVAEGRVHLMFQQVDTALTDRPFLLGEAYSAVDAYLFSVARWTRNMTLKARDLPHLGPCLKRVCERPAVQAAIAAEELTAPYF